MSFKVLVTGCLSRLPRRLVELFAFAKAGLLLLATGFAYDSPEAEKSVLVLYGERADLPAIQAIEENIRAVFHTSASPRIEVYPEYLDFTRFPMERYESSLVRFLQERYAGRRIDLIMPVAGSALEFVTAHREELLPGTPLVFCAIDPRELEKVRLPVAATGITGHFDFERTIGLILQLQPGVPEIVCVSGTASFDRRWAEETRKIFEGRYSQVRVRWITGKSFADTVDEVSRLPRTSAVLLIAMSRDGAGQSTSSLDVVRGLVRVSKAPIYGVSSNFLDAGVIGGAMIDFGENGRSAAQLALKALRGQWVPYGGLETESHNPLLINWQALKKAQLSESRVPKDAQVLFRPPGLWETHRTFILFVAGAMIFQAVLITGLIVERLLRRRAEASLRQSEERMSLVADGANLGMEVWDVERDEFWMTEKGRALFGLERDTPLDYAAIAARVHPDDQAARDASIKRAIETEGQYAAEYRVVRPDGTLRWIGARGRSMNQGNGKVTRLLGVSIDVTAQKQAEDRFRLVVEASPTGIVLVNERGQIVLVNAYAEKLFGYGREELIGQTIEILVPERFHADHPHHLTRFLAAPSARQMGAGRELFARRKDGSEFAVEIGLSPIQSQGGILVLAAIVDISARKLAEAEARQYRKELSHRGRVEILGEMAGSLAHELNQPLTGIMNNASAGRRFIAKGRADMPKLEGLFKSIVADARRAGEIIHGIRNMLRKAEGSRISVDLNGIIADVVSLVHSDAVERHCAVVTELDPGLPLVKADPVLLQQVLLNLIINAFDAMHKTAIAERCAIIRTECESGGCVRVSVRDFGTGLPAENPQRIFEQFFSTKTDGLGMGLAIARSIITSHGGELAAANAEGGGACVHFSLPAVAEDPA
jgi:PAS domain S-box-containing protein